MAGSRQPAVRSSISTPGKPKPPAAVQAGAAAVQAGASAVQVGAPPVHRTSLIGSAARGGLSGSDAPLSSHADAAGSTGSMDGSIGSTGNAVAPVIKTAGAGVFKSSIGSAADGSAGSVGSPSGSRMRAASSAAYTGGSNSLLIGDAAALKCARASIQGEGLASVQPWDERIH